MAAITTAEANAAQIIGAYEAFSRGEIQSVFAVFDENILWHVPGRGPLSGDYRGHDEVRSFFMRFIELSGATFRIQVGDVLAKGDRVAVLCTQTAQRGGRSWLSSQVEVWTVKDGRATVFWQYQGDQQTEDEFWSAQV
jgi:ketosteroid isomerase-like protein